MPCATPIALDTASLKPFFLQLAVKRFPLPAQELVQALSATLPDCQGLLRWAIARVHSAADTPDRKSTILDCHGVYWLAEKQ